jgi:hypothetical protein
VDDIQRLILEVVGEDKLKILTEQLSQEKQLLLDLAAGLRTNAINQATFDAGAQATAKTMAQLNQQINELQRNTRGASAQGLLQLQYIMDDLINTSGNWDRHIASISNNIPGLVQSAKGLGPIGEKIASWAGPIGIVATGLIALAPAAKAAWDAMSDGVPKEALDDLAERAKKLKSELDKLRASVTTEETETRKNFEGLLAGHTPDVERGIAAGLAASGTGAQLTREESMTNADVEAWVNAQYAKTYGKVAPGSQVDRARLQEIAERQAGQAQRRTAGGIRVNAENARIAGEMAAQIPTSAAVRQRVHGFAQASPNLFPHGFASDMAALEPDRMKADSDEADEWLEKTEGWAEAGKRRREARAIAKRKKAEADRKKKHDNDEVDRIVEHFSTTPNELDEATHREALRAQRDAQRELARQSTPAAQRQRQIGDYAARMSNYNDRTRSGLSDEQINSAATQAVQMVKQGANVNNALMAAFQGQVRQMIALQQQLQMQAARARALGMGPDQSGQYSYLPPALAY